MVEWRLGRGHPGRRRPVRRRQAIAVPAVVILGVSLTLLASSGLVLSAPVAGAAEEPAEEGWVTMVDEDGGVVICETGFALALGDEYLDSEDRLWTVTRLEERTAYARLSGRLDLSRAVDEFQLTLAGMLEARDGSPRVGIYHTHSDESYVPSDGRESDPAGQGGVYQVGRALARALEAAGVSVVHEQANHFPHDAGAYERSRRTAADLLKNAVAVFDVHRDAAPPQAYAASVGGRRTTKIMIVVGRANPQAGSNMAFARALKAAADQSEPGLLRGILQTGGSFNQDLSGRALLLEIGAHTNRREDAETAAALIGAVIPGVLGLGGAGPQGPGALRTLGVILVALVGGGALWLYVASGGSWRAALGKLRGLGEEFAGYLGRRRR